MAGLSITERLYRRATGFLPARLAARLDLMRPAYNRGWGGPMNGQERRQQVIRDLFAAVEFDEVVETGTFRGGTTAWLGEISGRPVHSVESEARFFHFAQATAGRRPGIDIRLGDSRDLLRSLAARAGDPTMFFYLDAHWGDDVPRHEELRIIHPRWSRCVVVIDDFLVPGDPGYGFARYGDHPLDETYLPELAGWTMFYPAIPSGEETGSRRGCAVFASAALADGVAAIAGLREARRWPA
jgi:predicted O-methyltransferase YrrM